MLLYRFASCLTPDCNPKTMASSFGVQTVITNASKHYKGALAIRRIFSLVDMITNLNFQIVQMFLKLVCFGSKICIDSIKIGFKAIHHL